MFKCSIKIHKGYSIQFDGILLLIKCSVHTHSPYVHFLFLTTSKIAPSISISWKCYSWKLSSALPWNFRASTQTAYKHTHTYAHMSATHFHSLFCSSLSCRHKKYLTSCKLLRRGLRDWTWFSHGEQGMGSNYWLITIHNTLAMHLKHLCNCMAWQHP